MKKSFDVFLSHNSKDKSTVRALAEALRARGLKVWLDDWEAVPGRPWQEALEEVIETTRASVVLVGKDGLGPWQDREMRGCLFEFADRNLPVIPVLLPGAPEMPRLPIFLKGFTWVDLRGGLTEEGIDRLQWGVTGKRPGALASDDLNEPQSFAEAGQLVPPQEALLGSSWTQATDYETLVTPPPLPTSPAIAPDGSSALLLPTPLTEGQAATVSTHMTRPSIRRGPLIEPGRTFLAASVAALVLLAVAAALFGWIRWSTPAVDRDAWEDERQRQIFSLIHTGFQFLSFGDPATAVRAFWQAEDLASERQKPHLRNLRMATDKQAKELGQLVGRQKQVVEHLMAAQQAMDNRRYKEALEAIDAALALDPGSVRAQEARASILTAQTRLEQQRKQRAQRPNPEEMEEIAANTTAPEPEPVATSVEKPVPLTANLHISFRSDVPGISAVRVHVNRRNVLQQSVGSKSTFALPGKGGQAERTVEVEAGNAEIEVWVTPPGKPAEHLTLSGNFLGGSSRSLVIRLPQNGRPSLDLN